MNTIPVTKRIKPPALQPGDTVGIVSPSWGGAGKFPHRTESGINQLETLGFEVRIGRNALNHVGYVSDTPANRVADIHDMFSDPKVKAIISAIGGDHSCHLLPLLDFDIIRNNPKIFMGFSDTTVLNVAIWRMTGLVTFNGPALLTDFAEFPRIYDYTKDSFEQTICKPHPIGPVQPSDTWTEEFVEWEETQDQLQPRKMEASPGWTWLKPGCMEGRLIGGCLESLEHLRGTRFWPDWEETIFFFETSEEAPPPERVDAILMDYENMGVLNKLKGLLVGRPMRYSLDQKKELREVLFTRTKNYDFPIISDMDFGHTSPQFIMPIGCWAKIDSVETRFDILDNAVD